MCIKDMFCCHGLADTFHEERGNPKSEAGGRAGERRKGWGDVLGYVNSLP